MELSRINISLFFKTSNGKISFFLYMFLEVRIDFQAGLQLGIKKNELEVLFKHTVENKSHFCVYVHETAHL